MTGATAWVLSRKYTEDSVIGLGAIKGASCTIKTIVPYTAPSGQTGNTVTFEWTANDGVTKQTQSMNVMDGVTITNIALDANDHLIFTLSDGTTIDSGKGIYTPYARNTTTVDPDQPAKVTSTVDPVTKRVAFDFEIPRGEKAQYDTMPIPDATQVGKVIQYTGNTTADYTHNYFYECIEDTSTSPSTYSWVNVQVQEGGGSADDHWYGTAAQWQALPATDKEKYLYIHFTDDVASGFMVVSDAVTDGDMNPVTSNAVYDAIQAGGGGGAALTTDVTSNVTVGAIPSGTKLNQGTTFTEFVQKLLITEVAPTIGFSITKSGNVLYGGSYTETLTVNVSAMGSSKTIDTIEWYQGSTLLQTDTIGSSTTGSWTYTMATPTTDTTTFKAIVKYTKSDNTQTTVTKTASINFYYNKFYGSVASLTPSEADVTALTTALGTAKGGTYTFTVSAARIAYAYPASLGNLTSIKDGNGFSLFDSFTKTTETYTQNGTSVSYNLYVLTDATTVSGYSVTFA